MGGRGSSAGAGKYVGSKGNKYTVKERYWENPRTGGRPSKTDTVVRKGW